MIHMSGQGTEFRCLQKSKIPQPEGRKGVLMKKTYKIEVDCANCALKMEEAARKVEGVAEAAVSFMTQKMKVEFQEGAEEQAVMQKVRKACKKVEDDCEIFL